MLSGKAIFAEEDVYAGYKKRRSAEQLVKDTLAPLDVPRSVIDVLSHALAFDPKKRYAKVDELSDELQQAIEPATNEQPRLAPGPGMSAEAAPDTAPIPLPPAPSPSPSTPASDPTHAAFHAPSVQAC